MVTMLTWLVRDIVSIVILSLVTLVALQMAYGWHHRLEPTRDHRRTRRRAFEGVLRRSSPDGSSTTSGASSFEIHDLAAIAVEHPMAPRSELRAVSRVFPCCG